jgi:hypothetical protein
VEHLRVSYEAKSVGHSGLVAFMQSIQGNQDQLMQEGRHHGGDP